MKHKVWSFILKKSVYLYKKMKENKKNKKGLLIRIDFLCKKAKNNTLKNSQRTLLYVLILANTYGFFTNNRFFAECLVETYMDAYGSTEMSPNIPHLNFSIFSKDIKVDPEMLSMTGLSAKEIDDNIPKKDLFFVNSKKNRVRKLTQHDIYLSLHHGLLSLYEDKLL